MPNHLGNKNKTMDRVSLLYQLQYELQKLMDIASDIFKKTTMEHVVESTTTLGLDSMNFTPKVDILESESEISIVVDVPGVKKSSLQVLIDNQAIKILGKRELHKSSNKAFFRIERLGGYFSRSLALPTSVDHECTLASLKNGELRITLRKSLAAEIGNVKDITEIKVQ